MCTHKYYTFIYNVPSRKVSVELAVTLINYTSHSGTLNL